MGKTPVKYCYKCKKNLPVHLFNIDLYTVDGLQKTCERHDRYWLSQWPGEHTGRYWKRLLSKARRKYAKMLLRFGRGKDTTDKESIVNYKTW